MNYPLGDNILITPDKSNKQHGVLEVPDNVPIKGVVAGISVRPIYYIKNNDKLTVKEGDTVFFRKNAFQTISKEFGYVSINDLISINDEQKQ